MKKNFWKTLAGASRCAILWLGFVASLPTPLAAAPRHDPGFPASLQACLARSIGQFDRPVAIYAKGVHAHLGLARGAADPASHLKLGAESPVRIASNTKTFVAATVLRLSEEGQINLDAPIGPLLSPAFNAMLIGNEYDTQAITVRHLLSHSSGLADHAADKRYLEAIFADPHHKWTRAEQISLGMKLSRPLSAPGVAFHYSDTGYILLGDIIERVTRTNLAQAVRTQLRFDRLGLKDTWWEDVESPSVNSAPRAHQFLDGKDVTGFDPSIDLFGGGGLVMSTRDLATFMKALFEGKVFAKPETLTEMLWRGPHKGAENYRLGIMVSNSAQGVLYGHSGFWGTTVWYSPATHSAVAGVTLEQSRFKRLLPLVQDAARGKCSVVRGQTVDRSAAH